MEKENTKSPISCLHCGNIAPMEIVGKYNHIKRRQGAEGEFALGDLFELLSCPSCKNISLQSTPYDELAEVLYPEQYYQSSRILYPTTPKKISGLPPKVSTAYQAALKVRPIDPNAFAVLLGRVMDVVLKDRKAKGKTIYDKLKDLAEKGDIPERVVELAQGLRQLRNVGAHADLGELTEKEIPILDDLIRAILEYLYYLPQLLDTVQKKIDKL